MAENPNIEDSSLEEIQESLKLNRIIYPIILGLGVVLYLVYRQFDVEEFLSIKWNSYTFLLLAAAVFTYVIRHLAMSWRLKILSSNFFSWKKSIQLIFIWEFASAVSPTSIGGSAVALFLLAQEKLSGAKTVALVLYSVVIDTLFFLITIPVIYLIYGNLSIRAADEDAVTLSTYSVTLWSLYAFMAAYGLFMGIGIYKPSIISWIIKGLAKFPLLKRYKESLNKTGDELKITAAEIRKENISFHLKAVVATTLAWFLRFLAIVFIIMAIVQTIDFNFSNVNLLYARSEIMHSIAQFFPTPGGSGFSEWAFGGFYKDFIPAGIATIVALLWRLITYYPYLIIGVVIIPAWFRKIWVTRKRSNKS